MMLQLLIFRVMEGQFEATQTYQKLQICYLSLRNLEGLMTGIIATRSGGDCNSTL